jgi:hypothetical protein
MNDSIKTQCNSKYLLLIHYILIILYILISGNEFDGVIYFLLVVNILCSIFEITFIAFNKHFTFIIVFYLIFNIGYQIKYFLIIDDYTLNNTLQYNIYKYTNDKAVMNSTYIAVTVGNFALCIASYLYKIYIKASPGRIIYTTNMVVLNILYACSCLLMVFVYLSMYLYNIAVMGGDPIELPYNISGILYYVSQYVIPALLLLCLHLANIINKNRYYIIIVATILVYGIVDSIVRTTKVGVILSIIMIAIFHIYANIHLNKFIYVAIFLALINIILWPFYNKYRELRTYSDKGISESIDVIINEGISEIKYINIVTRITGVDSLIPIIGCNISNLGFKATLENKVSEYYKTKIMGYGENTLHGSAPSLIGYFYIIYGYNGVFVGIILFIIVNIIIYNATSIYCKSSTPVINTVIAMSMIYFVIDGVFDSIINISIVVIGTCVFVNILSNILTRRAILYSENTPPPKGGGELLYSRHEFSQ